MSLKRKHVTFDESAGPEPAVPAAAAVHPDRARQVDGAAPAAKKPKVSICMLRRRSHLHG